MWPQNQCRRKHSRSQLLGGKCKQCKTPISARYPLVEALTGVLSGYIAFHFGYGPQLIGALFFCWILVALTFIDFDTQLLPDDLTLVCARVVGAPVVEIVREQ